MNSTVVDPTCATISHSGSTSKQKNDDNDVDDGRSDHEISNLDRFYTSIEDFLARKSAEVKVTQKCPHCWFPFPKHSTTNVDQTSSSTTTNKKIARCICDKLVTKLSKYRQIKDVTISSIVPTTTTVATEHTNHNPNFPLLRLSTNVRIIIYMHYVEWMNGGNSGKLLLKCLNSNYNNTNQEDHDENNRENSKNHHHHHRHDDQTNIVQLLLYGRRDDDEALRQLIQDTRFSKRSALLFPSSDAINLEDFVKNTKSSKGTATFVERINTNTVEDTTTPITLIVVDATYKKAKNMVKHFQKRVNNQIVLTTNDGSRRPTTSSEKIIPTVKLNLDTIIQSNKNSNSTTTSIFARAQKSYGNAISKSNENQGRVCTVEAVAYALRVCGESQSTVDALLDAVRVNNDAAKYWL